jgi:Helix-turn-helix domain
VSKRPEARVAAEEDEFVPLLGPAEVAKWLGVSSAWVRDHATRKSPRIPTVKVGKLLRFRPVDVREFIRDCWSGGSLGVNGERF